MRVGKSTIVLALSVTVCCGGVLAAEPPAGKAAPKAAPPAAASGKEALLNPASLTKQAPETYKAKFETSQGDFVVEATGASAPKGADRFFNLVRSGFYDNVRFFRVVPGFVVQFGIHGDPSVAKAWKSANIDDDPVKGSNSKGTLTFATAGPNTRTTQIFINLQDNARLDGMGFAPFAKIVSGMDVVEKLFSGYGDGAPRGQGPDQGRMQTEGNLYLVKDFPKLDYIKKATVVP